MVAFFIVFQSAFLFCCHSFPIERILQQNDTLYVANNSELSYLSKRKDSTTMPKACFEGIVDKLSYLSKRKDSTTRKLPPRLLTIKSCHTSPNERILQPSTTTTTTKMKKGCHTSPNERILQLCWRNCNCKSYSCCHTSPNERILQRRCSSCRS